MGEAAFRTTLREGVRHFSDEAVARDFLASLRWPDGVRCFACDSDRVRFIQSRSLWRCRECRKEFSVKKGTIFEDSPIPLSKWLSTIWVPSAGKRSGSSHQIARELGVTQKTAWFMAHRVRLAMKTDSFDRALSGETEDLQGRHQRESLVGTPESARRSGASRTDYERVVLRLLAVGKGELDERLAADREQRKRLREKNRD